MKIKRDFEQLGHLLNAINPSASFDNLQVPIPSHASDDLRRVYGQDIWDVVYAVYNHAEARRCQKMKARLITKSGAPDLS